MRRLLFALAAIVPMVVQATSLTALSAADVPALIKPPTHGERILALWSLDCVYCEANLQALAALQKAHPKDIELVPIATDDIAQHKAIEQRIHAAGMTAYPARAYADATPEQINYLLDPDWGGETPRTLVIRADGTRIGMSGNLDANKIKHLSGEKVP